MPPVQRQDQAFCDELANETPTTSTECRPHGHFALP